MKFRVVGQNRDTGARMALEFEAESKAAAERKAAQAGMSVHHVNDITDGHAGGTGAGVNPAYRGPVRGARLPLVRIVLVLVILAAVAWYFWPQISRMLHR
jgi:hypothetical protein